MEPIHILIIDDDEDDFLLVSDLLEDILGHVFIVEWASTFEAGQAHIRNQSHDIYLIDYRLAGARTGVDLISQTQTQTWLAHRPVIFLTGQEDKKVDMDAMQAGASDYLVKGQVTVEQLERSIRYALQQSKTLAQSKELATLNERQRLARDLHDVISQMLFTSNVVAQSAYVKWQTDPGSEKIGNYLSDLERLTRGAQAELRALLFELRPESLEKSPFIDLLQQLAQSTEGQTGIPVDLRVRGDVTQSDTKVTLYRMTQEAINNIMKHAKASQIAIEFNAQNGLGTLTIVDDGVGFMLNNRPEGRLGIQGMHERAAAIGATLTIVSEPGSGTELHIQVPLLSVKEKTNG